MHVVKVTGKKLPENATHGFKIMDDDEAPLFFHWHENAEEHVHVEYAHVLAAVPDRMEAMGYKTEVDAVLGEIIGMFGAG